MGLGECPQKYTSERGCCGVCQARPHPTLSFTLIVVGGPRSEGQRTIEACHPQHTASSFPGRGLSVLWPRGTHDSNSTAILVSSWAVTGDRVRRLEERPLFSRLFHEYRPWGPLADPHRVVSAGCQTSERGAKPSSHQQEAVPGCHMPLPPPNHPGRGASPPTCHTHSLLRPRLAQGTSQQCHGVEVPEALAHGPLR